MKKKSVERLQFITLFILIFGVIQLMFYIRNLIPPYLWGGDIYGSDTLQSILTAFVFTAAHTVYTSERLDKKLSMKVRMVLCTLPCMVAGLFFVYEFGLHVYIPLPTNKTAAIVIWSCAFLISFMLCVVTVYLIERKNIALGKQYNAALEAYKEKNSALQKEL